MTGAQLEARVLKILDNVRNKKPVEDDFVELKREWIERGHKAARTLAGSANAARGEDVLWIIGVDEGGNSVVGADHHELSDWLAQCGSCFENQHAPTLSMTRNVTSEGVTVVALLFDTSAPPYVVKNPQSGQITLEVPWRRGNRTLTARREDLLKLLVPVVSVPACEPWEITVGIGYNGSQPVLTINMTAYLIPRPGQEAFIPLHHCRAGIKFRGAQSFIPIAVRSLSGPIRAGNRGRASMIIDCDGDLLIKGPGTVNLHASTNKEVEDPSVDEAQILIKLGVAGTSSPITIAEVLKRTVSGHGKVSWVLQEPSYEP